MCGIAGIFDRQRPSEIDRALLERMTGALAHRGPDGAGFHEAPGIGLGHRRLAIIDLAGGDQPMFNEDGTVCVVFNGEIFNFQPLMTELAALGHRFRTRSDTEVIVHAWEEWHEACLDRFNGQFAFALSDSRTETLFLARDRLGEKPLYYSLLADGRLLFASELKSLLLCPEARSAARSAGHRGVFRLRLRSGPAFDLSRRQQAAARALPAGAPRRTAADAAPLLGPAVC